MANLLQTIAKQVIRSLDTKKSSASSVRVTNNVRTTVKDAQHQPVRVKMVAPTVGPDMPTSYSVQTKGSMDKPVEITSEEEIRMDRMTENNMMIDNDELQREEVETQNVSAAYAEAISRINTREDAYVEDEYIDEEKDDYLLSQIDEFREKAQKLQSLLLTKESKVMELQSIVEEREGKAQELKTILDERQKKADGITEEVSKQIENLIDKVTSKMEQIGESLGRELQDGNKLGGQEIEDLKNTLASLNSQQMEDIKDALGSMSEQQAEDVKNALASLNSQLEVVKSELSDKVHSENVKCYRNVADLLKMMEDKLETITDVEKNIDKKTKSIKGCTTALIVLTIINMLGIVAVILMELGVFKMFM